MQAWSLTDVGKKRKENQDSTYLKLDHKRNIALLMVCDGMGGVNGGAEASRIACEEFSDFVWNGLKDDPWEEIGEEKAALLMKNGVTAANRAVYTHAISDPSFMGMGTTLTAALIVGNEGYVINVGDSRTYCMKDELHQVTDDHSVAGDLFRKGSITREQYDKFPDKNIITRAVGTDPEVYGDMFRLKLDEGEVILLCSDGLTNMVPDADIREVLKADYSPSEACRKLVDMANQAGGKDNISIVVFVHEA